MDPQIETVVQAIHDTPSQLALITTGAGSQAIAWLLGVAGASRTVLDVQVPYSERALVETIGWKPEQFASAQTARTLAAVAHARAIRGREGSEPVIGVGCTAAIATDRPKKGAHRGYVAVWDNEAVTTYSLKLKKGARDRSGEEEAISRLVLRAIANACGVETVIGPELLSREVVQTDQQRISQPLEKLLSGEVQALTFYGQETFVPDEPIRAAVVAGSFNPLHHGHLQMARIAEARTGLPALFEISVRNVDKPTQEEAEIRRRLAQFEGLRWRAALTREPLYRDKARLFPGSVFVIGYDTVIRLIDPAYYRNDLAQMRAALADIRAAGCRFLVVGRAVAGDFRTLDDLSIPAGFSDLFEGVSEDTFRVDVSSTELRG